VPLSPARARGLLLFVALAAYATALGNRFAYDDNLVVALNPVVTEGDWGEAILGPYWPVAREGSGLYRPLTLASFTAEWPLWKGSPVGFHAVNVVLHAGVSLLVLSLLLRFTALPGALAGAVLFAIHPVHVEAVANVVGRAELLAALSVLAACVLYLDGDGWGPLGRGARLGGIALLYLTGLGSKEIAVTLPLLLVLVEAYRSGKPSLARRIAGELPVFVSLGAVLLTYLMLRWSVLGTVTGEVPAPALRGLTSTERVLTALSVWPEYVRLMVFPASLSADYSPGVILVARSVTPAVLAGAATVLAWVVGAVLLARRAPLASMGLAWFVVAVLPVSNLVVPSGVILAERTLYLPSVGVSLVLAAAVAAFGGTAERRLRRLAGALAATAGVALVARTVTRIPAWLDSFTVVNTLAMERPESYVALQHRAAGLARVGELAEAAQVYEAALALVPHHYGLRVELGALYARLRQEERATELLRRAIAQDPEQPTAYRLLAEQLVRLGRAEEGHAIALEGLARAGSDRELWSLVSEAYIAGGDLEAAVRARQAALGVDPASAHDWRRLAELYRALGLEEEAREAQTRADATPAGAHPSPWTNP
jgi:Flp pilus assembly protein TadD